MELGAAMAEGTSKSCHVAAIVTAILLCVCGTPLFVAGTVYVSMGGYETQYTKHLL